MKNITTLIEKYKEMLSAIEDTLNDEQDIDAKLILKSSKVVIEEIIQDLESLESEDECKHKYVSFIEMF